MQCMDDFNDSRECLHNDRDLFHEFVEQIFSNVINVFCVGENSLDSLDHCQRIESKRPKTFQTIDEEIEAKKYHSLMMVTFAILNSMNQQQQQQQQQPVTFTK